MRQVDKNIFEIIDYQYFGSVEFYSTLIKSTYIYFNGERNYQKTLHPNRTVVYGANGPIPLSIPLMGGRNQKCIFKEVQIANDANWQRIHWRSIHDSYRKAPWFEEYGWQVEQLYKVPERFLADWNLRTMKIVFKLLDLNIDILSAGSPTDLLSFLEISSSKFGEKPLEDYPKYQQVFLERHGFKANLSILDLIFCEGPHSKNYLQHLATYKNRKQSSN